MPLRMHSRRERRFLHVGGHEILLTGGRRLPPVTIS
jgi:hypothetical protein